MIVGSFLLWTEDNTPYKVSRIDSFAEQGALSIDGWFCTSWHDGEELAYGDWIPIAWGPIYEDVTVFDSKEELLKAFPESPVVLRAITEG